MVFRNDQEWEMRPRGRAPQGCRGFRSAAAFHSVTDRTDSAPSSSRNRWFTVTTRSRACLAGVHPGFCQENAHHPPVVCVGPALNPAHFFSVPRRGARDKLVDSMPIFGPSFVDGVPDRSVWSRINTKESWNATSFGFTRIQLGEFGPSPAQVKINGILVASRVQCTRKFPAHA